MNDIAKYITIGLTVLGMFVAGILYISSAHADIKSWTLEQNSDRTEQVMKDIDRHYVPKEDFVRIETDLKHIKNSLTKIERKLDRQ